MAARTGELVVGVSRIPSLSTELPLDAGGLGREGPGPGLSSFPGGKEGGRPPMPAASQLTPHLALCFLSSSHHPNLLAPHLTPDYLIKGKKLGAINDLLPPSLPPSLPFPIPSCALPARTQITVSPGGTRLGQRWKGLHQLPHFTDE